MKHHVIIKQSGRFDITVKHENGTESRYQNIPNLITNQGKDIYGNVYPSGYSGSYGGIIVGTGNTPPATSDIAMQTPIAASSNLTSGAESAPSLVAPYATEASGTFTFAVGAVVGNIAEVGMALNKGTLAATDKIFSRALIMVGGSPGTITVTASDQLVVTYTLTFTYAVDTTGSLNVTTDGTSVAVNYTVRPCLLGANSGVPTNPLSRYIGKIAATGWNVFSSTGTAFVATNSTGGIKQTFNSVAIGAYTAGTFTQNFTYHWNSGAAFSELLYFVEVAGFMNFQILFASAFGPTALQTMDFQVTYTWT